MRASQAAAAFVFVHHAAQAIAVPTMARRHGLRMNQTTGTKADSRIPNQVGSKMRVSMLIMLAPFVGLGVVRGFVTQIQNSGFTSARSRVQMHLKTSLYAEDPSILSSLPGDEAILFLSMISDDDLRRKTVKLYLRDGLRREQSLLTTGSFWHTDRSTFVQQSKKYLKQIGSTAQEKAWEKYITTGCERPRRQPQQMWACVDMTVQFSKVFHKFNEECQKEAQRAFQ